MKNTIILNTDEAANLYKDCVLDHILDTQSELTVNEFAGELVQFARILKELTSDCAQEALKAFRQEFRKGGTAMLLPSEDFDTIDTWSRNGKDYQIALFQKDGSPVGLVSKEDIDF